MSSKVNKGLSRADILAIRSLISYCPDTGVLMWSRRPVESFSGAGNPSRIAASWNARHSGMVAGSDNGDGYVTVYVNGKKFYAHRLAWALHYGEWPKYEIDHINHDRSDNRICNLRAVDKRLNARNMSLRRDSASGVTGVSRIAKSGKWYASIWTDGRTKSLGIYDSRDKAAMARKRAEEELGFHQNHGTGRVNPQA